MLPVKVIQIYEDLHTLSKERQKNWPDPSGPKDEDLEEIHLAKIDRLKQELATYGDTPT